MSDIHEPDESIVRAWSALAAAGKLSTVTSLHAEIAGRGVMLPIHELAERMQDLRARGYSPNERRCEAAE